MPSYYVDEDYPARPEIQQPLQPEGTAASAAPPLFRPSDPALCGIRPLVTPY